MCLRMITACHHQDTTEDVAVQSVLCHGWLGLEGTLKSSSSKFKTRVFFRYSVFICNVQPSASPKAKSSLCYTCVAMLT